MSAIDKDYIKTHAEGQWITVFKEEGLQMRMDSKHQPCPVCGGKDRFRCDGIETDGSWICTHCGAGDGLQLIQNANNYTFPEACRKVHAILRLDIHTPTTRPTVNRNNRARQAEALRLRENFKKTWNSAPPAPADHPYLKRKKIESHGARISNDALLLKVMCVDGHIHGLQSIPSQGKKLFTTGTQKVGHFYPIGFEVKDQIEVLYLAEGFATAASIHQATGSPVAVAFDSGNLKPVSLALREYYGSSLNMVICADNDTHLEQNEGKRKATKAAQEAQARIVVLQMPEGSEGTDFNDLHLSQGLDAVKIQLEHSEEPEHEPMTEVEPVDLFAEGAAPQFPIKILPQVMQDFCKQNAAQSGFDVGAYAFSLFVTASNCIDHRSILDVGNFHCPARQWGGLDSPSGGGKTPVLKVARGLTNDDDRIKQSAQEYEKWQEAVQGKTDKQRKSIPVPSWKQRNATDTTTEALGRLLQANPEGVNIYADEMSEFLGRMDAYSGGSNGGSKDRGVYLRAYDGSKNEVINRASRAPDVIENFSVGIMAGVQPELLANMFKRRGAGADGLYQRFLIYCMGPTGYVNYSAKVDQTVEYQVKQLFKKLDCYYCTCTLSDGARDLMQDYHNSIRTIADRIPGRRFAEHLNKYPGFLGRAAFTLHIIKSLAEGRKPANEVSRTAMLGAVELMRIMFRHSEIVYQQLDQIQGMTRELMLSAAEAILSKQWKQFSRGDLTRHATHWQGTDKLTAEGAIDLLIAMGWINDITPTPAPGRRGRKSDGKFSVNPFVHERFKEHSARIKQARKESHEALQQAAASKR